jgi:hypothetical protein
MTSRRERLTRVRRRRRLTAVLTVVAAVIATVSLAAAELDGERLAPQPETSTEAPPHWETATVTPPETTNGVTESDGSFRVECIPSYRAPVDPIVAPGGVSHHVHDFFGNTSTASHSTYSSMQAASTTCTATGDRAGYWAPALVSPGGQFVRPERAVIYYRNRPVAYGNTVAFPANFRMIAGGPGSFPHAYWTCDGESDTGDESRRDHVPQCPNGRDIKAHVFFPSCWDGVHLDAPDHRSHVAYGLSKDGKIDGPDPDRCPPSHPVKLPQLDFRVQYDVSDGRQYEYSDGEVILHADFWNTWDQSQLEAWIGNCLHRGRACKLADGDA